LVKPKDASPSRLNNQVTGNLSQPFFLRHKPFRQAFLKKLMGSSSLMPSVFLVLMGALDCITTAVGVLFFERVELNPLISSLVYSNMTAFVLLKLTITLVVASVPILVDGILTKHQAQSKIFYNARVAVRITYLCLLFFISTALINNIFVILKIHC